MRGNWRYGDSSRAGARGTGQHLADKVTIRSSVKASYGEVAFDPQTSGGLLIAVPGREADRLVRALRARGIAAVSIVGTAVPREDAWVILR